MNQEGLEKKQKRIIFYALFISLFCIIGVTYAFFTAGMSSETSTTVRADAGTMKITYDGGANINLSGIYPRDEVWVTKNITVTGNNTTDAQMLYKLTLVVDSNTFKTYDPLQYELVSTNTSANGEVIPAISKKDIPSSSIELGSGHFIKANNAKHTYQLKIYYPKKTTSQNDNQGASFSAHVEITSIKPPKTTGTLSELILYNNEVKTPLTEPGKEISAHVLDDITYTVSPIVLSEYQAYYITYGTGWEANGTRFNLTGTAVTTDTYANSYSGLVGKYLASSSASEAGSATAGKMKSTTNLNSVYYVLSTTQEGFTVKEITSNKNATEALLASTEDDYGTSYYFRGSVKNNYVEFANKCWRIVRITGDGSVKLVLHNDNTSNAANPCSSANNSENAAFAHYDGSKYTSVFNTNNKDNAYVGFMYGEAGASDYASAHANTNKSTILTNLETWYKNNLTSYADKLADTIWCNDKSIIADTTYNPFNYSNITGLGYGTNETYYSATKRLVGTQYIAGGTGPSLICSNNNDKLSKFTVDDTTKGNGNLTYKIGLLTADEIAFSGVIYNRINRSTYLQENTKTNSFWWSLTPYTVSPGGYTGVWTGGHLLGGLSVDFDYNAVGLRPSISLISTVEAKGIGTSENPYKVV